MIANAVTSGSVPSAANDAVISPVAVLLWSTAVSPRPAPKAEKRLPSALRQYPAQVGAERARDAALDHVQAPEQQRDATHQIENNDRSHWRTVQPRKTRANT